MDLEKESKGEKNYADMEFVVNHIEFIKNYLDFYLVNGDPSQNIRRVKRFLRMQTFKIQRHLMSFHFMNGKPRDIILYAKLKKDLDIGKIYSLLNFKMIIVQREQEKPWTKAAAKAMVEEIKNDLDFDGFIMMPKYQINRTGLEIEKSEKCIKKF